MSEIKVAVEDPDPEKKDTQETDAATNTSAQANKKNWFRRGIYGAVGLAAIFGLATVLGPETAGIITTLAITGATAIGVIIGTFVFAASLTALEANIENSKLSDKTKERLTSLIDWTITAGILVGSAALAWTILPHSLLFGATGAIALIAAMPVIWNMMDKSTQNAIKTTIDVAGEHLNLAPSLAFNLINTLIVLPALLISRALALGTPSEERANDKKNGILQRSKRLFRQYRGIDADTPFHEMKIKIPPRAKSAWKKWADPYHGGPLMWAPILYMRTLRLISRGPFIDIKPDRYYKNEHKELRPLARGTLTATKLTTDFLQHANQDIKEHPYKIALYAIAFGVMALPIPGSIFVGPIGVYVLAVVGAIFASQTGMSLAKKFVRTLNETSLIQDSKEFINDTPDEDGLYSLEDPAKVFEKTSSILADTGESIAENALIGNARNIPLVDKSLEYIIARAFKAMKRTILKRKDKTLDAYEKRSQAQPSSPKP